MKRTPEVIILFNHARQRGDSYARSPIPMTRTWGARALIMINEKNKKECKEFNNVKLHYMSNQTHLNRMSLRKVQLSSKSFHSAISRMPVRAFRWELVQPL